MPRMTHNDHGFHFCGDHEVKNLESKGWRVISEEEFKMILKAKLPVEVKRIGRPPKAK